MKEGLVYMKGSSFHISHNELEELASLYLLIPWVEVVAHYTIFSKNAYTLAHHTSSEYTYNHSADFTQGITLFTPRQVRGPSRWSGGRAQISSSLKTRRTGIC